jgi:hypothetical protein
MRAKSDRRQAFAAVAAAVGERGLAALARIAVEKSVLPFAADFRWLILAFHKLNLVARWHGKTPFDGAAQDNSETSRVKAGFLAWKTMVPIGS